MGGNRPGLAFQCNFPETTDRRIIMLPKRPFLVALYGSLLFGLTACLPGQSSDDGQAGFFVASAGRGGVSGHLPTGYGWKPNSKVEISIWNEPDGPGSASTRWKKIFDENVGADWLFGFDAGAPFYPVRRSICGTPEDGQAMVFMAKSLTTGTIRMHRVPVDLYFTFKPCP
jgi:hypothetical protein